MLALARAPVELAEAEVAMGDEGAHAEFIGERVTIVALSVLRRIVAGGNLAEEAESMHFVPALATFSNQREAFIAEASASSSRSTSRPASPSIPYWHGAQARHGV